MITSGCERISFESYRPWRWWVWIDAPFPDRIPNMPLIAAMSERPIPKGRFMFARGGACPGETDGHWQVEQALREARRELTDILRFRPTHALGPNGELIPLDDPLTLLEIAS